MLFMKVEMFGTQKSAMPLSFSNFDFLPIYKADSAGSRNYPFPTLQFLILNNSAVTSAIKRIFRLFVSEVIYKLSLEKKF